MPCLDGNENLSVGTRESTAKAIDFAATHDITESEKTQLHKFAAAWGMTEEFLTKVYTKKAGQTEPTTEEFERDFALIVKRAGQVVEARFPLATPAMSASALINESTEIPCALRKSAAARLLAAGATNPELRKFAQVADVDRPGIVRAAEIRALLYKDENHLGAIREMLDKHAECDPRLVVTGMDVMDRLEGLHKHYGTVLALPEQDVYTTIVKRAEISIQLVNGRSIKVDQLQKLAAERLRAIDDDLAKDLTDEHGQINLAKAAQVLPTLPLPDANMLVSLL